MKQEIFNLILEAEDKYRASVHEAVINAENYVDEVKKKQSVEFEGVRYGWYLFEKGETEKFTKKITDDESRLEKEAEEKKIILKKLRDEKIEEISERLKEEVLSFAWL